MCSTCSGIIGSTASGTIQNLKSNGLKGKNFSNFDAAAANEACLQAWELTPEAQNRGMSAAEMDACVAAKKAAAQNAIGNKITGYISQGTNFLTNLNGIIGNLFHNPTPATPPAYTPPKPSTGLSGGAWMAIIASAIIVIVGGVIIYKKSHKNG